MKSPRAASSWPEPQQLAAYFADTYAQAREAWLSLAVQACAPSARMSGHTRSFAHPLTGPQGEALATDCLWVGQPEASSVCVLIAGTHGVEGYAGSAIQRYLLAGLLAGAIVLPPDHAVLFIHALTPWGMAWYRRCDEYGIDLNRHFVDLANPPANPLFARVQPILQLTDQQQRATALREAAGELGQQAYEQAVSGGQYVDATAPFYGGTAANHGRRVIETLLSAYQLAQRQLIVLDLHTGLGPWGHGELICDHPADSAASRLAAELFGPAVTQPALGTSSSVPKHGLLDYAWHAIMSPQSCFLTLEFGSYGTQALFDTLIADHQLWARQSPASDTRSAMLEHFCPANAHWRQSVLLDSLQALRQALTYP